MTHTIHDQRHQIVRLQRERNSLFRFTKRLFCTILAITMLAIIVLIALSFFTKWPISPNDNQNLFGACLGTLMGFIPLSALLIAVYAINRLPNFKCPNSACHGQTSALGWVCGKCGHEHMLNMSAFIKGRQETVVGEPCDECGTAPTHFICPDCHTTLLLDATRSQIKAAYIPGYARPPRHEESVPLSGFPRQELD